MSEKTEISVVDDQRGSPTYAADLAEAILQIVASNKWHPGIYHYSNSGIITWFQFASAIRELAGFSTKVNPIPSSAYPTPAARPAYSALNTDSFSSTFGIPIKPWKDSLSACIKRLS